MKTLHLSPYFYLAYDPENELFFFRFSRNTQQMSQKEYLSELRTYIRFLQLYRPKGALGDMVNFKYIIAPETQQWINENLFSVYSGIGFKKIALLLSSHYIPRLSIEQTMEEDTTHAFITQYFDNEQEAKAWLLSANLVAV